MNIVTAILGIIVILAIVGMCVCVYFLLRNNYTYKCQIFATDLVTKYVQTLTNGLYDYSVDYYALMTISYKEHMYSFKHGKYSSIKPEYIELLKQFE